MSASHVLKVRIANGKGIAYNEQFYQGNDYLLTLLEPSILCYMYKYIYASPDLDRGIAVIVECLSIVY